jgi:polar amino acid transport system substrate-binding protein
MPLLLVVGKLIPNTGDRIMLKLVKLVLLITAMSYGALTNALELPTKITLVTDDYLPYTSTDRNGSGVIGDLVREAFAAMGIEVNYQFASWKRCEILVSSGEVFGAIPYFINDERSKLYDFSAPVLLGLTRYYYNREQFPNGFDWRSVDDFKGYRMGAIAGYWYIPEFTKAGLDVHLVGSEEQNFIKLARQRIDFTLAGQPRAEKAIRNLAKELQDKIATVAKPESRETFHVLVSRKYPHAQRFNQLLTLGLSRIIKSGQYANILKRYELSGEYGIDLQSLAPYLPKTQAEQH